MPQVFDEPVSQLAFSPLKNWPERFYWRGREHRVQQCCGEWKVTGRWWLGESQRHFFRLVTHENLTLDVCQDEMTGQWALAEILD